VKELPLIVIAGPTASGKTALAVRITKEFSGEIICADSRTIYRGLDIGTAKPTREEQWAVPHWGIDLVYPGERFTAKDFQEYATQKIQEIRNRGKVPVLVGGTGLYINSVLYDYQFPQQSISERTKYDTWTIDELIAYCDNNSIVLPNNYRNKRHLISAIMRKSDIPKRSSRLKQNTYVVGISTERASLWSRIADRAAVMFEKSILAEAQKAADTYGWDNEAMTGNIYPLLHRVIEGEITLDEARELFVIRDRQLAKRQMTWFRRDDNIVWLSLDEAYTYIARLLADANKS